MISDAMHVHAHGHAYAARYGDTGVPRIADDYLDCSVYLYQSPEQAREGAQTGGSGSVISYPIGNLHLGFILTNRHLIEDGFPVVRMNAKDGSVFIANLTERDWRFHPDGVTDLAMCMNVFSRHDMAKFSHFSVADFLDQDRCKIMDVGVGTDIFMTGRFIHQDGGQNNIPTARFGIIAQMPTYITDMRGRKQESYIVEARSIGGFSGSPVFAYNLPFQDTRQEKMKASWAGPAFLGVNWGHMHSKEFTKDANGRDLGYGMHVSVHTGMSLVIPAWRINALFDQQPFASMISLAKSLGLDSKDKLEAMIKTLELAAAESNKLDRD